MGRATRAPRIIAALVAASLCVPLFALRAFGQAPPEERPVPTLREPFASFVPPAIHRALRCQRFDISPDSMGVARKPGTHCVGVAPPAEKGDPILAMIQVDAEQHLMNLMLTW